MIVHDKIALNCLIEEKTRESFVGRDSRTLHARFVFNYMAELFLTLHF